jgi:putative inorganic carbon (hco3(-)) transporter
LHRHLNLSYQKLAIRFACCVMVGWFIYFLFGPTVGFDLADSWHNEQRLLQVCLLALTTLSYGWLLINVSDSVVRISTLLWLFATLGFISACFSKLPIHAAAELTLHINLAILAALTATLTRLVPVEVALILTRGCWLIGAVYLVGVAANFAGMYAEGKAVDLDIFVLGYANQRFVSALHALILPAISLLACDTTNRKAWRISGWLVAVPLWCINLAIGTRAIWVAIFVAGIAITWFGNSEARRVVRATAWTALAGVLLYVVIAVFFPQLIPQQTALQSRVGALNSTSGRFELWLIAINAIADHPLVGVGPMHFATLGSRWGMHPHNWMLQYAAEWGLPAMAVLLTSLYFWVRKSFLAVRLDRTAPVMSLAWFTALTAVLYGLLDGVWVMPVSQSLAAIFIGITLGLLDGQSGEPTEKSGNSVLKRRVQPHLTAVIGLLAALYLTEYTMQTFAQQRESERVFKAVNSSTPFLPRFWQQGLIQPDQKLNDGT